MLGLDKCVLRPFRTLTDWLILQPGPAGHPRLFDTWPSLSKTPGTRAISRVNFPHPTFD